MKKTTIIFLLLLCTICNSCKDDPFDQLVLVPHPYDESASLYDAINITAIEVANYNIHPSSNDTVSAKIIIKCSLNPKYFGKTMFQPLFSVNPEMYVNNFKIEFRKESTNDNYFASLNYPAFKNKDCSLLFKFYMINDQVNLNNRKVASNTLNFKIN
jgi:hypothetical protein